MTGKAANTRRAYETAWWGFQERAGATGRQSFPASPQSVALYLGRQAADGKAMATIELARAAICHAQAAKKKASTTISTEVRMRPRWACRLTPGFGAVSKLPSSSYKYPALKGYSREIQRRPLGEYGRQRPEPGLSGTPDPGQ